MLSSDGTKFLYSESKSARFSTIHEADALKAMEETFKPVDIKGFFGNAQRAFNYLKVKAYGNGETLALKNAPKHE